MTLQRLLLMPRPPAELTARALACAQHAVLAVMTRRARFSLDWMTLRGSQRSTRGRACFQCGEPTTSTTVALVASGARPRTVLHCPNCGVVLDVPEGSDWDVAWDGGALELRGHVPDGLWAGRTNCWSRNNALHRDREWPAGEDGGPAFRCADLPSTAGPHQLTLAMMVGLEIYVGGIGRTGG